MIRILILLVVIFLVGCDTSSKYAPPETNYFLKYMGSDGDQFAVDMAVDSDGMIYVLGNSRSSASASQKVYLAKVSPVGQVLWERYFGKMEMDAKDLELTSAGNLILVADRQTAANDMDILVKRYSKDGTAIDSAVIWSKVLGSNDSYSNAHTNEYVNSITELKNGDFILVGYSDNASLGHTYDVLNIQLDKSLNKMSTPYNENNGSGTINKGAKAIQYKDTIYIFGSSNFAIGLASDLNFWVWSINKTGYSSSVNNAVLTEFIKPTYDDYVFNAVKSFTGYGIAGISELNNDLVLRVIKIAGDNIFFNSSDIASIKEFPLGNSNDGRIGFTKINSGLGQSNFFVVSTYYPSGSGSSSPPGDIMLQKLNDQNLNQIWNSPIFFGGIGNDSAAAVEELSDGKILVLGTMQLGNPPSQYKVALLKLNADGKLQQ